MALPEITNYIEDDWDDNALTNRTDSTEGYFLHPSDGLLSGDFEAGDALKGVYRPEWNTNSGSPTATNGELQMFDGSSTPQAVLTPSRFTTGYWEVNFKYNSSPSNGLGSRMTLFAQTQNAANDSLQDSYALQLYRGEIRLNRFDGGTENIIIQAVGAWGGGTTAYTEKAQRDSYGNFEIFIDGQSEGTVTDTTYTEGSYHALGNGEDSRMDYDNLVIQ